MRHRLMILCWLPAILAVFAGFSAVEAAETRPNILWLSTEDISDHLNCYGHPQAQTPALDKLAREGVRYTQAFTIAGVCAVNRSGMITGVYPVSIGTQHMRCRAKLPEQMRCFPAYLRDAGYYCTNNSKTDYNFKHDRGTWDESSRKAHWKNRKPGQPFFAVFNFTTTHESRIAGDGAYNSATAKLPASRKVDGAKLTLPPYYPDTPVVRKDWARYYNTISAMDMQVAALLKELEEAGEADNTIVFFWSDHGVGLPRAKRWLYDSGTRIPLIIRTPEKFRNLLEPAAKSGVGVVSDELVSSLDFAPTVLKLAGINPPAYIQGRAFMGKELSPPRQFIFGHRDRMDERYDIIRMARDKRYKYIRNYEPWKAYYQYMNTPEKGATMKEIRRIAKTDNIPPAVNLFLAESKPLEEFYDTQADPHELNNLINSTEPAHQQALAKLREAHLEWTARTRDTGLIPEPELVVREQSLGNRYDILRQKDGAGLTGRIVATARLGEQGAKALPALMNALQDKDAIVRYWAAIGLGNLGKEAEPALPILLKTQQDSSAIVRIAAARAVCHAGQHKQALAVLTAELNSKAEWVRLNAAIVLDEIDKHATPAIPALKKALGDRQNKYVVRVANRALNELLGQKNVVP